MSMDIAIILISWPRARCSGIILLWISRRLAVRALRAVTIVSVSAFSAGSGKWMRLRGTHGERIEC